MTDRGHPSEPGASLIEDRPRVYVDLLPNGWGRWSGGAHMLANDLDALHAMADKIGLKRAWFQGDKTFAHYDLTASKRALALAAGAVEIGLGELPDDVLMRCHDGSYERRCDRIARRDREQAKGFLHQSKERAQ